MKLLICALIAFALGIQTHAQTKAAESVATAPAAATNPTFLFRSLSLSNEWDSIRAPAIPTPQP